MYIKIICSYIYLSVDSDKICIRMGDSICRRKLRKFKTKIVKTIIFMQIYIFDNDLFSTHT